MATSSSGYRDAGPEVQRLLATAGAAVLDTQPPEEATEYDWDGIWFSTAYFDTQPDDTFLQTQGRFDDWVFPADSFPDEPVELVKRLPVLAMSLTGMLAMAAGLMAARSLSMTPQCCGRPTFSSTMRTTITSAGHHSSHDGWTGHHGSYGGHDSGSGGHGGGFSGHHG